MDEKLREIALKYFQTEIIMFPNDKGAERG